jgi:hypothetical protein
MSLQQLGKLKNLINQPMVNQKNNFICVLSSTEQGINRPQIDYNEWAIMVRKENDMLYGIAKDYKSTY